MYATAYAFKNTQKDDSDRFIMIGTRVCKRLMRMRTIAMKNAALENTRAEGELDRDSRDEDFF